MLGPTAAVRSWGRVAKRFAITAIARPTTPAAVPRHPAWMAAAAPDRASASSTGTQSAAMTASASPETLDTTASPSGRCAASAVSPRAMVRTTLPWTWRTRISRSSEAPTPASADARLAEHLANLATAMATGLVSTPAIDEGERVAVDGAPGPEEALERAELREVVRRAVDALPEQERALVRGHYYEGRRFDEVAAELGLSKSWGSRLHSRAVARLTEQLREQR